MKNFLRLWVLVFSTCGASRGDEKSIVEVGRFLDTGLQAHVIYTAEEKEFAKVMNWAPGMPDFISMEKMAKLATERAASEKKAELARLSEKGVEYYSDPCLLSVSWFGLQNDLFGPKMHWVAVFRLVFGPKPPKPGEIGVRDGQFTVDVGMLPNGAPVAITHQSLTHQEIVNWDLEPMTEKELEENNKKQAPSDPFAPPNRPNKR